MTEAAAPAKARRKKSKSPTARTLEHLRARGWIAGVVEQTIPHTFIKRDLFGFADVAAVSAPRARVLLIQACSGADMARRRDKLSGLRTTEARPLDESEPEDERQARERVAEAVLACLVAGVGVEVWGWRMVGAKGTRKLWNVRRLKAELVDGAIAWDEVADA